MASDPEKIGRYQVIERVGRGGMGVLFRGIDPVLEREVAIKLMLVDFSEDEEQMRPRFYREARAVAKLQHRNIVTVFEFAEEGSTPFIVMEFLRGTSLAARMKSPLPLSVDTKLDMVAQLCTALDYAHQEGVIHRDVKPANVFVLNDGTVKLLDFGIAKVTTSTLTRKGDVLGSASYMSPEQISGSDSVDGRSDLFSAAVVLYELLSGRKPFHAEAPTAIVMKILHEPPPPLDELVPGLPPPLVAAVNRALAKKQEDRYPTAGDFANELQRIRRALPADGGDAFDETRFATPAEIRSFQKDAEPSAIKPASSTSDATEPAKKSWVIPAAVAAVVVVALGVGAMMMGRRGGEAPAALPAAAGQTAAASPASATAAAPARGATTAGSIAAGASTAAPAAERPTLRIETDPVGASIFVDGRDTKQTTPASIAFTGDGPHQLRLAKAGFSAQTVKLSDADLRSGSVHYSLSPAAAATAAVMVTSTYPVEVFDGAKSLGPAADSHQLTVPAGATLHVRSPEYLLDAAVKVEGKTFEYQAPALGSLTVLTKYETCNVKIGAKDLGFPPITKLPIVSGQHRVDIACANGQNPPGQLVTVAPNATATARIY